MLLAALSALAILAQAAFTSPTVHASGSVTYERRDYTVAIQRNGDVSVTERWQVRFTDAPFHHAFLRLYLARTSGIDAGAVQGASPNTQHVTQTTDAAGNPQLQIAWDFPSTTDTSRTFAIPYTIHGALGIGASQDWLDWHFLDAGGPDTFVIDSATISIGLPAPVPASDLHIAATDPDSAPQSSIVSTVLARSTAHHLVSNHPFEVEVAFPRDVLAASVARQSWQSEDDPPSLPTAPGFTDQSAPASELSETMQILIVALVVALFLAPFVLLLYLPVGHHPRYWHPVTRLRGRKWYPWEAAELRQQQRFSHMHNGRPSGVRVFRGGAGGGGGGGAGGGGGGAGGGGGGGAGFG